MAKQGLNGVALATMAAGSIFAYAGIKGYSVLQSVQTIISGKSPVGQSQTTGIGTPTASTASVTLPSGASATANPKSGTWTHDGLMKLWQQAGGSAGSANNAACHAIQESS